MASFADAIIDENIDAVRQALRYGLELNQLDEYGFTPLIEAAIADNFAICQLLLEHGAIANGQDAVGSTALHWAAENNNLALIKLLLKYHANPNLYNFAGQPILVMPMLRRQREVRKLLISNGADPLFAEDYINTKLLGHVFELIGTASIIDPKNNFVEVDFEGFFIETTIGLVADSLNHFQHHFAARQLRRYTSLSNAIVNIMQRASQLIKYQQYRTPLTRYQGIIRDLIQQEPLLIPVGYEGHAITFIKYGDIWIKCDRREDSRLYDNIMFYKMAHLENANAQFIYDLLYKKQSDEYINNELDNRLGLQPITELKVEAQISGNCSWANVEAAIPSLFFLICMQMNKDSQNISYYKSLALNFFHQWREWNRRRTLDYCIQSFKQGDAIRKASKAEILAAVLFQCCDYRLPADEERISLILRVLLHSPYEYVLKNYLRVYYYESNTEEGKRFAELLKEHGYTV